ncbi:hypothetical protein ACFW2E_19220, partial [Streptomyces sp. NPDC058964]
MANQSDGTDLRSRVADADSNVLLFGITPPRLSNTPERIREITAATLARLESLDVDGLALYDNDVVSDPKTAQRPCAVQPPLQP